jgi:hypothetical protein
LEFGHYLGYTGQFGPGHVPTGSTYTPGSISLNTSLVCSMSQPSSSSSFESIFNAALEDYARHSGIQLDEHHPLVKQLENCNSVDSITSVIQEHARLFREFRGEDGKLTKSLRGVVQVLYTLSTSTVLGACEGIGMVCPKSLISIFGP